MSDQQHPLGYDGSAREIRVLIVDDHDVVASSLALLLDSEPDLSIVGRAADLAEARRVLVMLQPDVLLLDHRLPDGDGVEAIRELRALCPTMRVVVLTASSPDEVEAAAVEAGAVGFVSKSSGIEELIDAVRAAALGGAGSATS